LRCYARRGDGICHLDLEVVRGWERCEGRLWLRFELWME
jgi:hypothetical protein